MSRFHKILIVLGKWYNLNKPKLENEIINFLLYNGFKIFVSNVIKRKNTRKPPVFLQIYAVFSQYFILSLNLLNNKQYQFIILNKIKITLSKPVIEKFSYIRSNILSETFKNHCNLKIAAITFKYISLLYKTSFKNLTCLIIISNTLNDTFRIFYFLRIFSMHLFCKEYIKSYLNCKILNTY